MISSDVIRSIDQLFEIEDETLVFILVLMQTASRRRYFTLENQIIRDMALKNCHVQGLHSIVFHKNGQYLERMFIAAEDHVLYKNQCLGDTQKWGPLSLAVHPHRIDIELEVITGQIWNIQFEKMALEGQQPILSPFKWNSLIINGTKSSGFQRIKLDTVELTKRRKMKPGDKIKMKADQLHTIFVERGNTASWCITQSEATGVYDGITYANHDLSLWKSDGLYLKPNQDEIKEYLNIAGIELK